jgi:hypothetical protein
MGGGNRKPSRLPPLSKEVVEWVLYKTTRLAKKLRFLLVIRVYLGTMGGHQQGAGRETMSGSLT